MTRGDWLTRGPSICGSSECYARPRRVLPSAASRTRCATPSSRTAARCELKLPARREASRELLHLLLATGQVKRRRMACRRDLLFWLSGSRLPPWRGLLHVTLLLPRRPQVALPRPIPSAADAAAHAAAQVRGAAQTAVSCHRGQERTEIKGTSCQLVRKRLQIITSSRCFAKRPYHAQKGSPTQRETPR